MSKFTFDCFVCPETLVTEDINAVIEFGKRHQDCDFDGAAPETSEEESRG